ncbi:MAG: hypothetical protein QOJ64_1445 [Acidobacteriota bacterium]|nr:hypothetical protein [Acidobacteriota bacterium]
MTHQLNMLIALCLLLSADAVAMSSKTYVSPTKGSDETLCTKDKPCKTIAAALRNTKEGGTVILMEAGETNGKCVVIYDRVTTITRSVTIRAAPHLQSKPCFIPRTDDGKGDFSITIEGSNIIVKLQSLKIAEAGGNVGIYFRSGSRLTVEDCDFSSLNHGIVFAGGNLLLVTKSRFDASMAIWLKDSPTARKSSVIDRSTFVGHTNLPHYPLLVGTNGGVVLQNSTISVDCPTAVFVKGSARLRNVHINKAAAPFGGNGSLELRGVTVN